MRVPGTAHVHVAAHDRDAARIRLHETGQQLDGRRLAGAVLAEQRMNGAALDAERRVVERDSSAEPLGDLREIEGPTMAARVSRVARALCPCTRHGVLLHP